MTGLLDQLLSTPAWLVLLVVFALPALESSALLGFIFPGETAVLLGGVAASQGHVSLPAVVVAGVGGAILGDAVGYVVGRRWGHRILDSTLGRFTNSSHRERAERALLRRGGWAVFIGRFTVALRVMIPGLAGMAGMPYRRFLMANVAGGAAWGALMATAGYLAGNSWRSAEHYVTGVGVALTGAVVALLVVRRVIGRLTRRRRAKTEERDRSATGRGAMLRAAWIPDYPRESRADRPSPDSATSLIAPRSGSNQYRPPDENGPRTCGNAGSGAILISLRG